MSTSERQAKWIHRPANELSGSPEYIGYAVRNRHRPTAFSRDGFMWFDSWGKPMDRPGPAIRFHGGPLDGRVTVRP